MRGSDDMPEWLSLLGHSDEDLRRLNAIHVAGTNGKGSTCAFTSSFLIEHGKITGCPRQVGLYTSPHMRHIRERIQINGVPISKECFATHFFDIWAKLPHESTPELDIPRYLQLLALLAFHVFIVEKVDVAIFEAHLGGEWDATNVMKSPTVVGITMIAEDHVHLLGPAIEDIAWHKSGIFKASAPAFSAIQDSAVTSVLRRRAHGKGVLLEFIDINATLPRSAALVPKPQRINCSLALAVFRSWLMSTFSKSLDKMDEAVIAGIERFKWPGRYQQISEELCQWYIDGAHNESSLRCTVDWFSKVIIPNSIRVLIFSHFSKRDTSVLLRSISESLQLHRVQMNYVIFTSYDETQDGKSRIDRNLTKRFSENGQKDNVDTWKTLDPKSIVFCERTIQDALDRARSISDGNIKTQVLVTGSLHLVSGALCTLDLDDDLKSDVRGINAS